MSTACDTTYSEIEETVSTELAHRSANGIDVLLLWERATGRLRIAVDDRRTGESFELEADGGRQALELFYHPFAA